MKRVDDARVATRIARPVFATLGRSFCEQQNVEEKNLPGNWRFGGCVDVSGFVLFVPINHSRKLQHAWLGVVHLLLLSVGFLHALGVWELPNAMLVLVPLAIVGVLLPLSAARDFKHVNVRNHASGTMDEHATVTRDEMLEHAFYQGLHVVQLCFLMFIVPAMNERSASRFVRSMAMLVFATSPWLVRRLFPVNSFSKLTENVVYLFNLLFHFH